MGVFARARSVVSMSAVLAAGVCLSGCDPRPPAAEAASPAATPATSPAATPAASASPAAPVATAAAPKAVSQGFRTSGPLVAEQQSDVAAELDGRVVRIEVQIGNRVRRGQVLAELDDRTLRAAVEEQSSRLESLRAQVREWQAEAKMDGADLRRADEMRESRILSEEGWEHVKYKLDEVLAEVSRYQADEKAAESELRAAKLKLEQCRIVAPFDGVVGRESLRLAQEVKRGDVLFWVTAEAPLRVLFTAPESAMAQIAPGTLLDLTTADYPELHQPARVMRLSPVVDPASGSVQVIGTLTHPSPLLKPGMSMQVEVADAGRRAGGDER
jgi:RND family efflux transporter MFP subunit